MELTQEQIDLLKQLVRDLVRGNYEAIVTTKRNGRLSLDDIRRAVEEYPGEPTLPTTDSYGKADHYPRLGFEDTLASVDFDLWFDGQVSDLTLRAEFVKANGQWRISIDDIHVL